MLKNYFLKVGNSYYISKELKRDLSNYSDDSNFYSISRFGIGFLSCFLCGIEAEISTLYFDDNKSKGEHAYDIGDGMYVPHVYSSAEDFRLIAFNFLGSSLITIDVPDSER